MKPVKKKEKTVLVNERLELFKFLDSDLIYQKRKVAFKQDFENAYNEISLENDPNCFKKLHELPAAAQTPSCVLEAAPEAPVELTGCVAPTDAPADWLTT